MFVDNKYFPWLPHIQDNWRVIRRELEALQGEGFSPWPEKHFYNQGWNLFGLYGWGVRLDKHCDLVPETDKLLRTIPGLLNAGFSRMGPKTHIRPHKGFPEGVLRLHIPLIIPEGCALRVERQVQQWEEGKLFVFDDCSAHEAWNNSDQNRTVLLADFPADDLVRYKPRMRRTEKFVRRLLGKQTEFNYRPQAAE
jgi:beta-hydroxylase